MSTKVTIAIPVYNGELCLRETLDSALAQSMPAYEIVVVDDGSTDGSEEIIRSYGERLRYIKQPNQGIAGARNTAIQHATGDWIAFLDHDDIMLPTKIEKQCAVIESNPEIVVVYSGFSYLHSDGSTTNVPAFPAKDLWPAIRYRTPILPSTAIVRRSALLEIGGFRRFHGTDDWDLWFRLVRRYSSRAFREVPESLTLYRWWENNTVKNFMPIAGQVFAMLDTVLLEDLHGLRRIIWKRRIEARILYELSLDLREAKNDRYWEYAIESLLKWPFCGDIVSARRYQVMAHMLYTRLGSFHFSVRYWWPNRRCREGLALPSSTTRPRTPEPQ